MPCPGFRNEHFAAVHSSTILAWKNNSCMSPKRVVIYSSHATGHRSMRALDAPGWRTRDSEHRLEKRRWETETESCTTPSVRRMSASSRCQWIPLAFLCLPVDILKAKDKASIPARIQESYSGLRVFSGKRPPSPPVTDVAVFSVYLSGVQEDKGRGRLAVAVQGA